MVQQYCADCHSGKSPAGGVDLTRDHDLKSMMAHRDLWDKAAANIASLHMPPQGMPAPTADARTRMTGFVQSTLSKADCALHDPGRVTVRRLNRAEYDNTVRALTGLDKDHLADVPSGDFPPDDVGYGFDNIGDVLSLSSLQMEKYLSAAEIIARAAIVAPEDPALTASRDGQTVAGATFTGAGGPFAEGPGYYLPTNGEGGIDYDFPAPGKYNVRVVAWEQHAGADNAQMAIRFGGQTLSTVDVKGTAKKPSRFDVVIDVPQKGKSRIAAAFLNDYYNTDNADVKLRGDRNLILDRFVITPTAGVVLPPPDISPSQGRLLRYLPKADTEAAKATATRADVALLAKRAFRRPPTAAEIDRLCALAAMARQQGGSFEKGMQYVVEATLVSPNFLFRFEHDPNPTDVHARHLINDYELATRLSYFLWSTMPDDRLLGLADDGKLHNPEVLLGETRRMLTDPRSSALGDNFAAQWLTLRKLATLTPDPARYPSWNENLRNAMRNETLLYFDGVVHNDRSVLDFLDSNYTYLNGPLAALYGVPGVQGNEFRKVNLTGDQRGGLLTQASVLTVTSNPTRTSPVKRGKWVMENLLGIEIPAPPPGVGQLPDDKHGPVLGTLRQRMEAHRSNPACASCHAQMDPIGFGLENYDAIGKWRSVDGGSPIDSAGQLPGSSVTFKTPGELKTALRGRSAQFVHTLSSRMLTYALGRGVESYDRCTVDTIATTVDKHGDHFSALIDAIVTSDAFRERRGDPTGIKPVTRPAVVPAAKPAHRVASLVPRRTRQH